MRFGGSKWTLVFALIILLAPFAGPRLFAQTGTGTLPGQLTDPSGAAVADAAVVATNAAGQAATASTNRDGIYELKNLAPGKYSLKVVAKGFALFEVPQVEILAGQNPKLDVQLTLEVREEKVVVSDQAAAVLDTNPASNAGAIVLQGKDLEALSDDPDDLQNDL